MYGLIHDRTRYWITFLTFEITKNTQHFLSHQVLSSYPIKLSSCSASISNRAPYIPKEIKLFWIANMPWLDVSVMTQGSNQEKTASCFLENLQCSVPPWTCFKRQVATNLHSCTSNRLSAAFIFIHKCSGKNKRHVALNSILICIWKSDHLLYMFFLVYSGSYWAHDVNIFHFMIQVIL